MEKCFINLSKEDKEKIYKSMEEYCLKKYAGKIILTSTPRTKKGFFWDCMKQ